MSARNAIVLVLLLLVLGACQPSSGTADDPDASEAPANSPTESSEAAAGSEPGVADDDAIARVVDAAAATADAGTLHVEASVQTEGTAGEDGVQPILVAGDEDLAAQQRSLTFSAPTGELQVVVDGEDVYVEIPATEDEQWARVDLSELTGSEVAFGGPGGLPFASSAENLALLADAVTSAAESGTEEIDGETTTRFDLVVDLAAAAAAAPDEAGLLQTAAEESGVTELDVQVWVTEDDHVRQVAYALDLGQADVGATVEAEAGSEATEVAAEPAGVVSVTVTYSAFGEDVSIEIPPADAVIDLDEDEIRSTFGQ